jgi:two-component system, NarL family, invasion response regulator UvrY
VTGEGRPTDGGERGGGATSVMRALVVDGDERMRTVLGWLLGEDPRFELAGSVGTGGEAAAFRGRLDAALVDLAVPGLDALRTVRALRAGHPGIVVIVLADVDVPYFRSAAADAGAAGYVERTAGALTLVDLLADLCLGPQAPSRAAP